MREVTQTVYTFNELPSEIQDKVIEKNYDINVTHDWWEFIYDDAEQIGLEITEFDDSYCKGKFTKLPVVVANNIIKEHGEQCNTNRAAFKFLEGTSQIDAKLDALLNKTYDDCREEQELLEVEQEELYHEFLNSLLNEYRITLRQEAEHLMSRDSIIEAINANDYEFLIDGTPFRG